MSLRAFHVIFIICAILLAFGFGFWAIQNYYTNQLQSYLWASIASVLFAIGLIVYEVLFLKKVKA